MAAAADFDDDWSALSDSAKDRNEINDPNSDLFVDSAVDGPPLGPVKTVDVPG
jgi:hypothetical protein